MDIEGFNFNQHLLSTTDFQNSNVIFSSMNGGDFNNLNLMMEDDHNTKSAKSANANAEFDCNLMSDVTVQSRIKFLEEELANTQADKEFVWSLWRQLQTTNPDVTNCIGAVVKREKEKNEIKDRKVLEILQVKDDKINELYELFQVKDKEINELSEKLKKTETQLNAKVEELNYMEINSKTFADKEQMYEQMIRGRDDKFDKTMRDNETEKQHLISKLRDLVKEAAVSQENESCLRHETIKQKETINSLNKEIKQANENYEKLIGDVNQFPKILENNFNIEADKLRREIAVKNEQNEKLRKELNELWSKFNSNADFSNQQESIIKQLKQSQNEMQNTIRAQQETFEQENASLKTMYDQMCQKYELSLETEKQLANEKIAAHQQSQQQKQLQSQQLKQNEKSNAEAIKLMQYEIEQLKLKNQLQLGQLNDKKDLCDSLNKRIQELEKVSFKVSFCFNISFTI